MAFASSGLQTIHNPFSPDPRAPKVHVYSSSDPHATVEGTGYFEDGKNLGLSTGDLLFALNVSTAGSSAATAHIVSASTAAVSDDDPLPSSAFNQAFNVTVGPGSS